MKDTAIQVEGLGKQYRIGSARARHTTLRDAMADLVNAPFRRAARLLRGQSYGALDLDEAIWALRDVSFGIKQGEIAGIIGSNGAGKSTLLKILSRITGPTEGLVRIRGRVGSLLEVGTGFHPELTGRENIFLNGAILGMGRKEIAGKLDEIIAFAGIEKFINTPVKFYSSGMYVRLAFAVAAHLDPEILLVDEVLAVGDYRFQEKCLGKMREVTGEGRTVLFVSHNMKAVSQICPRAILLDGSRLIADGDAKTVIGRYMGGERGDMAEMAWPAERAPGNHSAKLLRVRVCGEDYATRSKFRYDEPVNIYVTFEVLDDAADLFLRMYLINEEGVNVFVATAVNDSRFTKGVHEAKYTVAPHLLNEGRYFIQQVLFKEGAVTSPEDVARADHPVSFSVDYSGKFTGGMMVRQPGVIRPDADWEFSAVKRAVPEGKNEIVR